MPSPTSVNVVRVTYVLICEMAGVAVALSTKGSAYEIPIGAGIIGGLLVAGFFMLLEAFMKGFTLRGFSTATFGLLVGLFCAWLLKQVGISEVVSVLVRNQDPELVKSYRLALEVCMFASLGFIGASLAIRSDRDDFSFIIPYVRFRQDATSGTPIILDAESIIDGRVARVLRSGFLTGRLVIPRFILHELEVMANSPTGTNRQRGQRGLVMLEQLQAAKDLQVSIEDVRDVTVNETLNARLLQTARLLGGRLMTYDKSLEKIGNLQGVEVLNIDNLSDALRPEVVVGEALRIALVRTGKDEHQAVGYLPDGTMVVVNHAISKMGTTQDVRVLSTLQTSAGMMVFAEMADAAKA